MWVDRADGRLGARDGLAVDDVAVSRSRCLMALGERVALGVRTGPVQRAVRGERVGLRGGYALGSGCYGRGLARRDRAAGKIGHCLIWAVKPVVGILDGCFTSYGARNSFPIQKLNQVS